MDNILDGFRDERRLKIFFDIQIARNFVGRKKNFTGQHFWAHGYHVSTVGRDEEAIRKYIKEQEKEDRRIDQLNLFDE